MLLYLRTVWTYPSDLVDQADDLTNDTAVWIDAGDRGDCAMGNDERRWAMSVPFQAL